MTAAPRRREPAPVVGPRALILAAALVLALLALFAAPAYAGWSAPRPVAPPVSTDVVGPLAAVGRTGELIAYALSSADASASSSAFVVSPGGHAGPAQPVAVPGAQQVLDLAFAGSGAQLLVGSSPSGLSCCSQAAVTALRAHGRFSRAQTVVRHLNGATVGRLVAVGGGKLLAVIGTSGGVWVAQSDAHGRFTRTRRLTGRGDAPQTLAATALAGGGGALAWSAAPHGGAVAGDIFTATGSSGEAPARRTLAVRLAAGHSADEVALASAAHGAATLAWSESWLGRGGGFRSQVEVRDLSAHAGTRTFAVGGTVASGVAFGSSAGGTQVLAWRTCTASGACAVRATVRRPGKTFASAVRLGAIDGDQVPAVAVSSGGGAIVGWIAGGHVLASTLGGGGFSAAHVVSSTQYADGLVLAYGPGSAVAAWSQGTLAPEVVAATYR